MAARPSNVAPNSRVVRPAAPSRSATGSRPSSRTGTRPVDAPTPAQQSAKIAANPNNQAPRKRGDDEDFETNINVVVRCRGRSEREVKENSAVVLSLPGGVRGKEVTVQTGAMTLNNKTYSFDRVFGPEADQATIYDDVVGPVLRETLSGYNCTIFAYGQTGTGKTYTMSGDASDNGGTYKDSAGIIPRTLYRMFHTLNADKTDYSVKCSFIELYNEELRDLLAIEEEKKVKIFEDTGKKGVIIQGMEEVFINSAGEGVHLLQLGSRKRQVASTKCNDLSSRSHTVFTITVHMKEVTDGEDLLRVGKLNLVDLAGSENIGRSGAENKRAREAGMINQSLLTLGRVINSLVDRSPHIPYRESKLTRLLQDSLGGRTKTCIIATLSPSKLNLDETLSTLEYASRAKNIRNKPQVNQMMTKKTLLKDYVLEIEKLKGDLQASRYKNGVYMTQESWEEVTVESESRRILAEEQSRKIEVLETSLKSTREQFEQHLRLFSETKKDLERTEKTLDTAQSALHTTQMDLTGTRQNLEAETVLRKAHESTEWELDTIANGLIDTLSSTVADVNGLHGKVGRKLKVEMSNQDMWSSCQHDITDGSAHIETRLTEFTKQQQGFANQIVSRVSGFLVVEMKRLTDIHTSLDEQAQNLQQCGQEFDASSQSSKSSIFQVLEEIKDLREKVKVSVGSGLHGLNMAAETIVEEIHNSYSELGVNFKIFFSETQKHLHQQANQIKQLKRELAATQVRQISALEVTAANLNAIMEEEKMKSAAARSMLMSRISSLVNETAAEQENQLASKMQSVRADMAGNQQKASSETGKMQDCLDEWGREIDDFGGRARNSRDAIKGRLVESVREAEERSEAIQASTRGVHAETVRIVDEQMQSMTHQMQALDAYVQSAQAQNAQHYERQNGLVRTMCSQACTATQAQQTELTESKGSVERFGKGQVELIDRTRPGIEDFRMHMAKLVQGVRDVVALDLERDQPTGETPKKREYEYVKTLPRTKAHGELVQHLHPLRDVSVNRVPMPVADPIDMDMEEIRGVSTLSAVPVRTSGEKDTKDVRERADGRENTLPMPKGRKKRPLT